MTRNTIQYFEEHTTFRKYAKCTKIIKISTVQDALDCKVH